MEQDQLDGLLTMFIEQGITYDIDVDEVIEYLKINTLTQRHMVSYEKPIFIM